MSKISELLNEPEQAHNESTHECGCCDCKVPTVEKKEALDMVNHPKQY